MSLDLRVPLGLVFAVLGLLLVAYGLVADPAVYEVSFGVNVNLWSGLAMALFGAAMLGGAWRAARRVASGEARGSGKSG